MSLHDLGTVEITILQNGSIIWNAPSGVSIKITDVRSDPPEITTKAANAVIKDGENTYCVRDLGELEPDESTTS